MRRGANAPLRLLEKQRAAVSKGKKATSNPGDALLSRLAKGKAAPPAQAKTGKAGKAAAVAQPKATAAATARKAAKKKGGADKVARAKQAAGERMDVDGAAKPKSKPEKPKPKTQADLDEEMKAYERQRKFATA